ncbi:threonine transporter [Hahella sp. CCB-MM4]|uniref:LysE family translocator n=1 Tax=Hahella sp. (strain CCB-MM4) TaxID=1926491 RepID=UPI000B9A2984|nr:LysE family translocator [Hahella sp. CCB-MM4]OZG75013.1 threonine transporter [Hahella sp. CCB-MM4]
MQELLPLLGIASAIAFGAISPGPSFLLVARESVASSRTHGLFSALGMGIGGVIFALAALAGLQAVFAAVPGLYLALKIGGGLYLGYLGYKIWKGARNPLDVSPPAGEVAPHSAGRAFWIALATQISNPKAAVIYTSVFAAFLPQHFGWTLGIGTIVVVFTIETSWYTLVALGLSSTRPRNAYLRYKAWVDRVAGGVMGLLGIKLVTSANQ